MPPPFAQHGPPRWNREQSAEGRANYPLRGRFVWRFGLIFFALALLSCAAFAFLVWLATRAFGVGGVSPPAAPIVRVGVILVPLLGLGALLLIGRAFRRAVVPVGEVIEAAQRVADGDYTIRVEERGPREVRGLTHAFNAMTARLQANDSLRRALLADISHELRTPLTVIQGNVEGMLDGVYPLDRSHLEPVLDETRQLARLIEDLRTLALAESGGLALEREPTDVGALLGEAVAAFRPQADAAGITLTLTLPPTLPTLHIDPRRIRQVLDNLLYNALHFTERGGGVVVSATRAEKVVTIQVQDSGRGIPPDELPHIFERFYKARDSRGTGLGLAIAKSLVEMHGGEIGAASTVGQGTRIWFSLVAE